MEEDYTGEPEAQEEKMEEPEQPGYPEQEQRKEGGGPGGAIVLILIIIIGLVIFFMTRKPGGGVGTVQEILPQECAMLIQVDLDKAEDPKLKDEIWKNMKNSPIFKEKIAEFEKTEKVNLDEDIFSWLGGQMTLSLFTPPKKEGGGPSKDDHFAVVFSVKDLEKSKTKMKELMGKSKDVTFKEEQYEGTTIVVPSKENFPSMAYIKGMLVMGNNADDLKACVDAANKKKPNLKENAVVKLMLEKLPAKSIGTLIVDVAKVAEEKKDRPMDPEEEKFMKSVKGMGMSVNVKDGNVIGTGFFGLDKNSDSVITKTLLAAKPSIGELSTAKLFPADTSLYAVFDLNVIVKVAMETAAQSGGKEKIETAKEQMKAQGIDLDKDIIENLAGEFAYAMDFNDLMMWMGKNMRGGAPGGGMMGGKQPPPMVLTLKTKDKQRLNNLINNIAQKAGPAITKKDHAGVTIYEFPQNSGGLAVFQEYLLLGMGMGSSKLDLIIDNKLDESKSLASTEGFKMMKGKLGSGTVAFGMVKFEKIMPMLMMLSMAAAQKGPQEAEAVKEFLNLLKQYNEVWGSGQLKDDGIMIEVVAIKSKTPAAETPKQQ